tara:strand:- start:438 stop:563 length:126 start_codon:yes stop_codon:yes gene_type:complete
MGNLAHLPVILTGLDSKKVFSVVGVEVGAEESRVQDTYDER